MWNALECMQPPTANAVQFEMNSPIRVGALLPRRLFLNPTLSLFPAGRVRVSAVGTLQRASRHCSGVSVVDTSF